MVLERAMDAEGPFLLPSSSLCRVAVLNKVPFFFFFKSNFDFLINVTSEKTISKNCRVKFIVYSVGVLIGIAQNVII